LVRDAGLRLLNAAQILGIHCWCMRQESNSLIEGTCVIVYRGTSGVCFQLKLTTLFRSCSKRAFRVVCQRSQRIYVKQLTCPERVLKDLSIVLAALKPRIAAVRTSPQ
jgi:hypothetical protein